MKGGTLVRTWKLSLAGTVILALLGGLGATVVAQSEEPNQDITRPKLTTNLDYGDDPKQIIHAYELEPRAEPRPAVVFFHGGGLVMGEPLWDGEGAKWLAERGYVTFMAGYRLYDQVSRANPWPTQLDDAQRAIRWVRAHADEFNVDPERVCALGYSAGGYLVGLLGTLDTRDDSDPDLAGFASRPDCVVMGAGDGDLTVPYPEQYIADVMAGWLGGTIDEASEVWEAASPAHNIDADTPPFLVIHGTDDEYTPVQMSHNFVDAMREAGREVEYLELPGRHEEVYLDNPEFWPAVERFLLDRTHPGE
jgi:acetyl esterase/lipase